MLMALFGMSDNIIRKRTAKARSTMNATSRAVGMKLESRNGSQVFWKLAKADWMCQIGGLDLFSNTDSFKGRKKNKFSQISWDFSRWSIADWNRPPPSPLVCLNRKEDLGESFLGELPEAELMWSHPWIQLPPECFVEILVEDATEAIFHLAKSACGNFLKNFPLKGMTALEMKWHLTWIVWNGMVQQRDGRVWQFC